MEKQNYEIKITIADILRIFIWRLWLIVIAGIVASGAALAYFTYTYQPVYKSVSRIYILRQNTENETISGYAQNLNAALTIVNDCKSIIKSDTTMKKVKESTGLEYSTSSLLSSISLSSTDDSRIVQIIAKSSNPIDAKLIADAVAKEGVIRIKEVMGYDQARIMEESTLPSSPANSRYSAKILLVGFMAGLLVYAFYLIRFLSNDKISEPEEITDYLGLTVLGVIPNEDIISGKKKYKGYGSYYKYKKYGKNNGMYNHPNASGDSEDAMTAAAKSETK